MGLWPYYLAVYTLPTSANLTSACNIIHTTSALIAILGCSNHVTMATTLPNFTQYVSCSTREERSLDLLYANMKDAYRPSSFGFGIQPYCPLQPDPPLPVTSTACFTADHVRIQLVRLHSGKAAGPDGVIPRMLKACALQLCGAHIFNMSDQRVPMLWKTSYFIHRPKMTFPSDSKGYRPVTLASQVMTTLERLVLEQLQPIQPALLGKKLTAMPTSCPALSST